LAAVGHAARRLDAHGRVLSPASRPVRGRPSGAGVTSPVARIPFVSLVPREDDHEVRDAIARVIARGLFVLGPEVGAFEAEFARASGAGFAVGVGNGTDAIALTLRALGIGRGDEVITTPLSAAYTALAIIAAGARPVFADIDPVRLTIDPAQIEQAIT